MASPVVNALRSSRFRRLFLAQTISRWGDTFNFVALVILVFQLTGSGLKVAGIVAFEIVPVLAFGFIAGAVVDRLPRARVMIAADIARAAIALALALSHESLWMVYLAAFGLSSFSVFFNPAAASVVPALVEEEDLIGANSGVWSGALVSQIVVAPLTGALVATAGAGIAFGLNAVSFLISAALLKGLRVERAAHVAGKAIEDVREGWRVVRRSRFLRGLLVVQIFAALSAGATSALLVVLAQEHLDVGATSLGFLLTAIGVGAALGPVVLQRLVTEVLWPLFLFGPYLLRGMVDLVLAASKNFGVAMGALALYGVGTSTGNVTYNTALQKNVSDRLRGRVFATYDVVWQTFRLLSLALGGVLADAVGIRAVYVLGGVLLLMAATLGALLVRGPAMQAQVDGPP
jgi:MFS family permease